MMCADILWGAAGRGHPRGMERPLRGVRAGTRRGPCKWTTAGHGWDNRRTRIGQPPGTDWTNAGHGWMTQVAAAKKIPSHHGHHDDWEQRLK